MRLTSSSFKYALMSTLFCSVAATAQEVQLISPDSGLTMTGELLKFEDRQYTIRTSLGELVVSADDMDCTGEACPVLKPPAAQFRVSGAKTPGEDLLPRLFDAYAAQSNMSLQIGNHPIEGRLLAIVDEESDPLANVQIVSSTSSTGLVDLLQGDAQMALSTRPPRQNESDAFEKSGLGQIQSNDQEYVLGLESIVILTSPQNPISSISETIAAQIFAGEITNWAELGGPNAPINVYVHDPDSPAGEAFNSLLMAPQAQQVRADAIIVNEEARLAQSVITDPNGIGFARFGDSAQAKLLDVAGECGLRVAPNAFSIKSEAYPLTRRLSAYTASEIPEQLTGFMAFLGSEDAQKSVGAAGFVTQDVITMPLAMQNQRLASAMLGDLKPEALPKLQDMVKDMADATQLSLSFRFVPGTNRIDARTHADLKRLAALLGSEEYAGKSVNLASFTEAAAIAAQNQPLSVQRGQMILSELLAIDPDLENKVSLKMTGYGDISPINCPGTLTGQHANSRVEVWVKDPIN